MTTSYLIPKHAMRQDGEYEFRQAVLERLTQLQMARGLVNRPEEVDIVGMCYTDLGLTSWNLPPLKTTPTDWIQTTVPHNMFYAFTEVMVLSKNPAAAKLDFQIGHGHVMVGTFSLDGLKVILPVINRAEGDKHFQRLLLKEAQRLCLVGFFSTPIIYHPTDHVVISVTAEQDTPAGDRLALGGFMAAPRQMVLA